MFIMCYRLQIRFVQYTIRGEILDGLNSTGALQMTLVGPGFHFKRLFLPFLAAFGDLTWRITRLVEMQNRKILKNFKIVSTLWN